MGHITEKIFKIIEMKGQEMNMKLNYWEVSWEEQDSKSGANMIQFELKVDHIKLKIEQ